jgi:hypothetical protein
MTTFIGFPLKIKDISLAIKSSGFYFKLLSNFLPSFSLPNANNTTSRLLNASPHEEMRFCGRRFPVFTPECWLRTHIWD